MRQWKHFRLNHSQLQLHRLHGRRASGAQAAGRRSRRRRPHAAARTAPRPAAPRAPCRRRDATHSQPGRRPSSTGGRPAAAAAGAAAQAAAGGGRCRAWARGAAGLCCRQLHPRLAFHTLQQGELRVLGRHSTQRLQHAAGRLLDLGSGRRAGHADHINVQGCMAPAHVLIIHKHRHSHSPSANACYRRTTL